MARILVIDDSPVMRAFLTEFLKDEGHEVDVAPTGEEGIEMATSNEYHLCICDMHMPKMSGLDVLEQIESLKPSLQIMFTDSLPNPESSRIFESGNYKCLKKPFDIEQLRSTLRTFLLPVRN